MNYSTHKHLRFYTTVLLFIVLLFIVLYEARVLLIPLSFALLISLIYYPAGVWFEKKAGRVASIAVCLAILLAFGFALFQVLAQSILLLNAEFAGSQDKIISLGNQIFYYIDDWMTFAEIDQKAIVQQIYDNLLKEIFPFVKQTIFMSASSLAMMLIVPIFVSLILYYRELLMKFVLMAVPEEHAGSFKATIKETTTTYFKFAKGMGIVYLIVGVLNSIGFLLLGLPNAVYFGMLASVLTFFPYIGIFIGGTAAMVVAWTTFDSGWYPVGVIAILSVVQYLEANVIFPVAVGRQIKVNPFATLAAVILGGIIWGGAGMILFVPFAAILKILADRVDGLQPIAVLLGPDIRIEKERIKWFWEKKK